MAYSLEDAFDRVGESLYQALNGKNGKKLTFKSLFGDALDGLGEDMFKSALSPFKNMFHDAFGSLLQSVSGDQRTTPPIGKTGAFLKLASEGASK